MANLLLKEDGDNLLTEAGNNLMLEPEYYFKKEDGDFLLLEDGTKLILEYANTAPTVALNTPADAGSISDDTPTLEFTGTDAEGDVIEYEIQIDTVNTFDSVM